MAARTMQHSTVTLRRTFAVPAARVFAALTEPAARQSVIGAASQGVIIADTLECRVGCTERYRFGDFQHPRFDGTTTYAEIVPGRRIIATDVVSEAGARLSISLATYELTDLARGSELRITAHVAWLDGGDEVDGADSRYRTLLDKLAAYLSDVTGVRRR